MAEHIVELHFPKCPKSWNHGMDAYLNVSQKFQKIGKDPKHGKEDNENKWHRMRFSMKAKCGGTTICFTERGSPYRWIYVPRQNFQNNGKSDVLLIKNDRNRQDSFPKVNFILPTQASFDFVEI